MNYFKLSLQKGNHDQKGTLDPSNSSLWFIIFTHISCSKTVDKKLKKYQINMNFFCLSVLQNLPLHFFCCCLIIFLV